MQRKLDWPERLAEEVDKARKKPYVLGEHDCLRFTCACIQAMTDVDFWPRFAGYSTKRGALVTIARIAPSLGGAVDIVLNQERRPALMAKRGDVVLYADPQGEHLGVCIGASVAVLSDTGLLFVNIKHPGLLGSWSIG